MAGDERIDSLPELGPALWTELQRATCQRGHSWRVLCLATVCAEPGAPQGLRAHARNVVLREVRPLQQQLLFYTDARSPKVAEMQAQPCGTLLAWSPALGWQLRLEVTLSVATSGLEVSSRWAQVQLSANAQDYIAARPPGTPMDHFEPDRGTRAHFAVVTAQVTALDWLELHPAGHRRARIDAEGARWLAP
jgi:pyridoxamine 5'-phosphate oxidase